MGQCAALSQEDYMGAVASRQIKYLTWQPADIAMRLYDGVAVLRYRAQLEVVFGEHKIPLVATATPTSMRIVMDSGQSSGRKRLPSDRQSLRGQGETKGATPSATRSKTAGPRRRYRLWRIASPAQRRLRLANRAV